MEKYYYGIRFLGGNRTCTIGSPNPRTGRFNTACEIVAFKTPSERRTWINSEKLSAPTGLGGGERDTVTVRELNYHLRGYTPEERAEAIKYAQCDCDYREEVKQ